jgi:hypothetical protein
VVERREEESAEPECRPPKVANAGLAAPKVVNVVPEQHPWKGANVVVLVPKEEWPAKAGKDKPDAAARSTCTIMAMSRSA